MNNDTHKREIAGFRCNIAFADTPDEVLCRYLSVQKEDSDDLRVRDEDTFYYLDPDEIKSFLKAVDAGEDYFMVGDEWFIIIADGCDPVYLDN